MRLWCTGSRKRTRRSAFITTKRATKRHIRHIKIKPILLCLMCLFVALFVAIDGVQRAFELTGEYATAKSNPRESRRTRPAIDSGPDSPSLQALQSPACLVQRNAY